MLVPLVVHGPRCVTAMAICAVILLLERQTAARAKRWRLPLAEPIRAAGRVAAAFIRVTHDLLLKSNSGVQIVKAVTALGRSLGMATVAEGVDQLDIVRKQGCTEVQGYLFSKPIPAEAANEFAVRLDPRKSALQSIKLAS